MSKASDSLVSFIKIPKVSVYVATATIAVCFGI